MKEEKKSRLRDRLRFPRRKTVSENGVPEKWRKRQEKQEKEKEQVMKQRRMIKIPGWKFFKQLLAALLFLVQFGAGFSTLILAMTPGERFPGVVLLLSSFMMFEYLWKTRRPDF